MDLALENQLLSYVLNYKVLEVPNGTQFWMIRTQKGYFYSDFIKNRYIALGWNIIDKNTDLGKKSLDGLKDLIQKEYGDNVPGSAINKCKKFRDEMKEGDIVVIPDRGAKNITFAIVGEYFEVDCTVDEELKMIPKIRANQVIGKIVCPYKKRRKIKVVRTMKTVLLNPHLVDGITSYHGLSQMDTYAKSILDSMYESYVFGEISSLQIGINTNNSINAIDFYNLIGALTDYLSVFTDMNRLDIAMNLNSPGQISISENTDKSEEDQNAGEKIETIRKGGQKFFHIISKSGLIWLGFLIAATGGKYKDLELPGIVGFLRDIKTLDYDIEEEQNNIEIQKLEIERMQIENLALKRELIADCNEDGIDMNQLINDLDVILGVSERLELGLGTEETQAVTPSALGVQDSE